MATFFKALTGETGLRLSVDTGGLAPIPAGAMTVEFDEAQNSTLLSELQGKIDGVRWQDFDIVAGVLQKSGVHVTINPALPLTDVQALSAATVALALLTLDEINLLREWLVSFKAAVAGAGSLAALKTAVAALPDTPDRTRLQLLNAVKAKLADV